MKKRYRKCPFCGENIKDSAIKCMYCKKWLNTNENRDSSIGIINEVIDERKKEIDRKETKFNVWTINSEEDKKLLWLLIGFQFVCLFGAFFPCVLDLFSK